MRPMLLIALALLPTRAWAGLHCHLFVTAHRSLAEMRDEMAHFRRLAPLEVLSRGDDVLLLYDDRQLEQVRWHVDDYVTGIDEERVDQALARNTELVGSAMQTAGGAMMAAAMAFVMAVTPAPPELWVQLGQAFFLWLGIEECARGVRSVVVLAEQPTSITGMAREIDRRATMYRLVRDGARSTQMVLVLPRRRIAELRWELRELGWRDGAPASACSIPAGPAEPIPAGRGSTAIRR